MTHRYRLPIAAVLTSLSILTAVAQGPPFTEGTAAFRGIVTEVGTGQPLAGVGIHVDARLSPPVAVTDATGRFVVDGLDPGVYRVFAERDGMVFTETCEDQPAAPCMTMTFPSGQIVEIEIEMRPATALSGRVLDVSGEPVVGVRVSLRTYGYTSGQRVLADFQAPLALDPRDLADCRYALTWEVGPDDPNIGTRCEELASGSEIGRGVTNNEGEWRLEGIPPGDYYVVASPDDAEALDRALPDRQVGMWLPIYFPGTPFEEEALPIHVASIPEVSGIDIRWAEHAPVAIRGIVSGLSDLTDQVVEIGGERIRIGGLDVRVATAGGLPVPASEGTLHSYTPDDSDPTGAFEFLVPPFGEYVLTATAGQGPSHSGQVRLAVGASDVDGIVLPVVPALDVQGQILFDPMPGSEEVSGVSVRLRDRGSTASGVRFRSVSSDSGFVLRTPTGGEISSPVSANGTFVVRTPVRWDYELSVDGLPEGYFLESASFGGVDLLRDAFNPADAPGSVIIVRVGDSPGEVRGLALDARGAPFGGAEITLVPEGTLGGRRDLYRSVEADSGGRFALGTVAPGPYRVFAWDSVPLNAVRNTDFLAPYLGRGRFVIVDENATVDLELPLIQP